MQNKVEFVLVKKEIETQDVVSLFFDTVSGRKYEFLAGQYVDIAPPDLVGHGKSYTISSAPSDELVRITVKRQGAVSSALIDMQIGQKVFFEGPYGVFYPEDDMKDVVMIAGGIGITPFVSIIKDHYVSKKDTRFTLLYSNKTRGDMIFFEELEKYSDLKVIHFNTREKNDLSENSRINADLIIKYISNFEGRCFYICGSIGFVRDIWKVLRDGVGISEDDIYTESFY